MTRALVNGVNLYYEATGSGFPLVWCHEFAGSYESWDAQVKFFSRYYRVVTYNARGYPPSDVPEDSDAYSQDQAVEDLYGLLRRLGIERAHVGGLSMGGSCALVFGVTHPDMASSLIGAGAGTGATDPEQFRMQAERFARDLEERGMDAMAGYARGPSRVQLLRKNPKAWEEFNRLLASHSPKGSARTLRGVQGKRPPIFEMESRLRDLAVPTLIITGDEDDPCLEPSLFLKRCIPRSGLVVLPRTGHAVNLEEPDLFNRVVLDFLREVELGRWPARDSGSGVGFLAQKATEAESR